MLIDDFSTGWAKATNGERVEVMIWFPVMVLFFGLGCVMGTGEYVEWKIRKLME